MALPMRRHLFLFAIGEFKKKKKKEKRRDESEYIIILKYNNKCPPGQGGKEKHFPAFSASFLSG